MEYYSPKVRDYQPNIPQPHAATQAQTIPTQTQAPSGPAQGAVLGQPQTYPVANGQVPPPGTQPISNPAATSEKIVVAGPAAQSAINSETAPRGKRRYICGCQVAWFIVIVVVSIALLAIVLGFTLGFGLAGSNDRFDDTPRGTLIYNTATSTTDFFGEPTTEVVTETDGNSMVFTTTVNTPLPSFDIGGITGPLSTYVLAASPSGVPTTTVTIVPLPPPETTGLQTASVFHSSTFSPEAYVSTITYTAPPIGATAGIGIVGCPSNDLTGYVATNGALFQKLCYSDIGEAPNWSMTLVNSLDACIEACTAASDDEYVQDTFYGTPACQAVSYGANITLAYPDQRANCWFKTVVGVPTPGDWQQATARFLGFVVSEE